ncbi:hypothetical protein [Azospirillum brasilense]|uniref:Uncharacterized protein n=1 Tax=Azospirillum brasilense TaxID=192 RepID=A0A235HFR8_AZOBR|nr:hypothetical protein [Azospirillum brasilense]OYD84669.1 hypothetical protein CHT98_09445 [Azospirillum brasilense]
MRKVLELLILLLRALKLLLELLNRWDRADGRVMEHPSAQPECKVFPAVRQDGEKPLPGGPERGFHAAKPA